MYGETTWHDHNTPIDHNTLGVGHNGTPHPVQQSWNPYVAKAGEAFGGGKPDPNAGFKGSRPAPSEYVSGEAQSLKSGGFALQTKVRGAGEHGEDVGMTHYYDKTGRESHADVSAPNSSYSAGMNTGEMAGPDISSVAVRDVESPFTGAANAAFASKYGGSPSANMAPENKVPRR